MHQGSEFLVRGEPAEICAALNEYLDVEELDWNAPYGDDLLKRPSAEFRPAGSGAWCDNRACVIHQPRSTPSVLVSGHGDTQTFRSVGLFGLDFRPAVGTGMWHVVP